MPKLRNGNNGDSNPGSLDCESGILPTELPRSTPVDRSPRVLHSSTHNVVRASWFEVLTACVESRKLFLDGSLCWAGVGHGVDVWGQFLGGSDLRY